MRLGLSSFLVLSILAGSAAHAQEKGVPLVSPAPVAVTWQPRANASAESRAYAFTRAHDADTTDADAREQRRARFAVTGVIAGAIVGGRIGYARTKPVEDSFFGFEYVAPTFVGILVGGLVGGVVGTALEVVTRR